MKNCFRRFLMGEIGGNQESKELVWTGRGRCVRTTEPSLNARKESVAKLLMKMFFCELYHSWKEKRFAILLGNIQFSISWIMMSVDSRFRYIVPVTLRMNEGETLWFGNLEMCREPVHGRPRLEERDLQLLPGRVLCTGSCLSETTFFLDLYVKVFIKFNNKYTHCSKFLSRATVRLYYEATSWRR